MSGRGEIVSFGPPLEGVRAALGGAYTARSTDAGEIAVRDELDKLVCRLGVSATPGGSHWLTLAPLKGYRDDAERIRELLLAAGFVSEKGWRSARVPMTGNERADVVVGRVLLRLLQIMDANLPGALADADAEFLHDYRVAIRRTRSVLRELSGVFDPAALERVRAAFKWLQDETSMTRDLDVYLHEFDQLRRLAPEAIRADLEPIEPLLRERHRRARAAMRRALSSDRAKTLRADWWEILQALVLAGEDSRAQAARPIGKLVARRIVKVHRQMVRMGAAITPESDPDEYHDLRKKGKELRYLLELFGAPLFDPGVVKPLVKTLKELQDVLGLHQDREVQIEMLRELGQELVARPGGPRALMAIGTLIDRLEHEAAEARGRYAASFAEFASEAQCKLVAKAFG
ncbi:MAG TPA: CHAD domain-containing protein [Solirubrobacteraceae bacterium]|nr:CHAD domain-containing protein [Solirubrobacteraceae bacterium]